jgi:hypothetical protein
MNTLKRKTVLITKEEAATRQLHQAIRLFFQSGDMLSVHTLAAASHRLLIDLGKSKGVESLARSSVKIRPEYHKEWLSALARTQNFLKHAERDQDKTYKYVEDETAFLLIDALDLASRLLKLESAEKQAFVPPNQAEPFVAALRARQLPCEYVLFPDEGHGFRQAANIQRAAEAELQFYLRVFGVRPV